MSSIQVITLPSSEWKRYKAIRLEALQSDPIAFAESFQEASVWPDEEWQTRLSDPDWTSLFAQDGEQIVGMIVIHHLPEDREIAMIHGVYVSVDHRGKGVGKLLMSEALRRAEAIPGVRKIKLDVVETQVHAVALYKSAGFEVTGTFKKSSPLLENDCDEFIMEKHV